MCLGYDIQGSILTGGILQRGPCRDNIICRPKWEISQILMHRMPRTAAHSWRLIDEHGMNRLDILPAKTLQIGNEPGIGTITLQNIIKLEILELCDRSLTLQLLALVLLSQGNILNHLHPGRTSYKKNIP